MDPALVARWIKEGQLPNMAKLASQGGLHPLRTTHSPESPTAWASFATGVNPGKHNIYDFLVRDTNTYLPDLGMVRREPPKFLLNYFPIARPRVLSIRGGTSFWVTAGPRRRAVERPHRTGDFSSRGRTQRRAARRTSPARHQGHDGHLLLLRDGSESIRRRQHRVRRDSETPVDGRRRRAHGARGTAEPGDPSAGPGDSKERDGPQRSAIAPSWRSCRRRRTSGCR